MIELMASGHFKGTLARWITKLDPFGEQARDYLKLERNRSPKPPSPIRVLLELVLVIGTAMLLIVVITLTER